MALQLLSASGLSGRNRHQSRHDTIVCIDMRYTLGMDYADSLQLLSVWDGLDAYARFSPDGIVPQKAPVSGIHRGMPILRSDFDLTPGDPHEAARVLVERVKDRKGTCFHWFRIILRSPQWYVAMMEEAQRLDPSIKLLDAPSFFEMLRQNNN